MHFKRLKEYISIMIIIIINIKVILDDGYFGAVITLTNENDDGRVW